MLAALRRSGLPLRFPRHRLYATVSNPQTLVEKIVQKYAVDLPAGTKVHSGDYVMIKPEHVYVSQKCQGARLQAGLLTGMTG